METKDELRKRFHGDFTYMDGELETQWRGSAHPAQVFDFFWNEIESIRNTYNALDKAHQTASDQIQQLRAKISRLEATLEAADALIDKFGQLITSIHESVDRSKARILLTDSDKIERLSNEVSEGLKKYSYQQKQLKSNQAIPLTARN